VRFRAEIDVDAGVIFNGGGPPAEGFGLAGLLPGAELFVDGVECGELIEAEPFRFDVRGEREPVRLDVWLDLPVVKF